MCTIVCTVAARIGQTYMCMPSHTHKPCTLIHARALVGEQVKAARHRRSPFQSGGAKMIAVQLQVRGAGLDVRLVVDIAVFRATSCLCREPFCRKSSRTSWRKWSMKSMFSSSEASCASRVARSSASLAPKDSRNSRSCLATSSANFSWLASNSRYSAARSSRCCCSSPRKPDSMASAFTSKAARWPESWSIMAACCVSRVATSFSICSASWFCSSSRAKRAASFCS
mmetsp:Transcript_27511/g.77827  ORF Transcript_27511/g.77827 Transcript_27511/m.77827 type:complete len:227 (+) Transcript_27511:114-794(+)